MAPLIPTIRSVWTGRLGVEREPCRAVSGSVNRMLMDFRAEGLIGIERKAVIILDWNSLKATGQLDPAYLRFERNFGHSLPG